MAVFLRVVFLLRRSVLHHGGDGGGAGCQHLHREEQGAPLPLPHRHLQEHHARHAPPAQLPLPPSLPLLLALDRPVPLPRPFTRRRWGEELWPAPFSTAVPRPHFCVHPAQPSLPLPHGLGWRRHLPLHAVPWPQTGRVAAHVRNSWQGHALPASQLLPQGRWRRRGDDERYAALPQVPQPFQLFQL